MRPIDEALNAADAQKNPVYAHIAEKHSVDRSTLSRRHRSITTDRATAHETQSHLTKQQSETLINYIDKLINRGIPSTPAIVRNFIVEILQFVPGVTGLAWLHWKRLGGTLAACQET